MLVQTKWTKYPCTNNGKPCLIRIHSEDTEVQIYDFSCSIIGSPHFQSLRAVPLDSAAHSGLDAAAHFEPGASLDPLGSTSKTQHTFNMMLWHATCIYPWYYPAPPDI